MEFKNLFDKFSTCGKLLLPDSAFSFDDIPWSVHPAFDGVELKNNHYFRSDRRAIQLSSGKNRAGQENRQSHS